MPNDAFTPFTLAVPQADLAGLVYPPSRILRGVEFMATVAHWAVLASLLSDP
jgi:hypothetical protein